jgi:large subunit ribosomal protein L22
MESMALLKYVRVSPRKVRRITKLIKGKKAGDALVNLKFLPHSSAKIVAKILKSAMANAEQKKVADPESMRIVKAFVDQGPTMDNEESHAPGYGKGRCYQEEDEPYKACPGREKR